MSEQQEQPTLDQAITIRAGGKAELTVHNASFRPKQYTFGTPDELIAHLGQVFGVQPQEGSIRGSMSRKGTYVRRRADGTQAVTFGDPVLDEISSETGTVVIAGQTIDLNGSHGLPIQPTEASGRLPVPAGSASLVFTGMVNGAERWASQDRAMVQYRLGQDTLTFHAWKKDYSIFYWSMGGEISTTGRNFEAANIDSFYYMRVHDQECAIVKVDQDSARNDSYADEYEWGVNAPQPRRVATLCRAQWNDARFADLLTAGEGCEGYPNDAWPIGWPADWPPLTMRVEVQPSHLAMHVPRFGVSAQATTVVINHNPNALAVQVDASPDVNFSYPSGAFTVPGNGQLPIPVMFLGGSAGPLGGAIGTYSTSVRIVAGGQMFVVRVTATVRPVVHQFRDKNIF